MAFRPHLPRQHTQPPSTPLLRPPSPSTSHMHCTTLNMSISDLSNVFLLRHWVVRSYQGNPLPAIWPSTHPTSILVVCWSGSFVFWSNSKLVWELLYHLCLMIWGESKHLNVRAIHWNKGNRGQNICIRSRSTQCAWPSKCNLMCSTWLPTWLSV